MAEKDNSHVYICHLGKLALPYCVVNVKCIVEVKVTSTHTFLTSSYDKFFSMSATNSLRKGGQYAPRKLSLFFRTLAVSSLQAHERRPASQLGRKKRWITRRTAHMT